MTIFSFSRKISAKKVSILLASTLAAAITGTSSAATLFDFTSSNADAVSAFNNQLAGASITADSVTLSTVVVTADEFDGTPTPTGTTTDAQTFVTFNGLVIDNPSISDPDFFAITGDDSEAGFISVGEVLTITFDTDVSITSIDFFGIGGDEDVAVSVTGLSTFNFVNGTSGDTFTDPFGTGTILVAGTDISFTLASTGANDRFSLTNIEVAAIPEPSSVALLSLAMIGVLLNRRRPI